MTPSNLTRQEITMDAKKKWLAANLAETVLESEVLKWINEEADEYDEGALGVLSYLEVEGCASGIVGHLIYYRDTTEFFARHRAEINTMLVEYMKDYDAKSPEEVFPGWDCEDPLAQDVTNQNLLAWFAWERAGRTLANRAGIET